MKLIVCIVAVAAAFALGWNAKGIQVLRKISDILTAIDAATKEVGKLSESDCDFIRGMLKTISFLQDYEED